VRLPRNPHIRIAPHGIPIVQLSEGVGDPFGLTRSARYLAATGW